MNNELQTDETIHLVCFHGPAHAGAKIHPIKNPLTGEYPSCVRKVSSSGDIIYNNGDDPSTYFVRETEGIIIKNGTDFDLTNAIQKAKWDAIKFSDLIFDPKGKVDENGNVIAEPSELAPPTALFFVERVADEAKKRNSKERLKTKAKNFIYSDTINGLKTKAMILGCFVKTSTSEEIEEYLVNIANSDPQKVINLYTGSDTKLYLYFIYGKEYNILQNKGGLYIYGDSIIGRTDSDCVTYFKNPNNKAITDRIIKEINNAVTESENIDISKETSTQNTELVNNEPTKNKQ